MPHTNVNDNDEWFDYPYIGIGEKPNTHKYINDEFLEKIIGG